MGYNESVADITPTEILASDHFSKISITVASGAGSLVKGTVMGRVTTGAASGYYQAYDDDNTDGSQVAVGILADKVDATASSVIAPMYTHGTFYIAKLTGFDTNCQSDLQSCVFVYE